MPGLSVKLAVPETLDLAVDARADGLRAGTEADRASRVPVRLGTAKPASGSATACPLPVTGVGLRSPLRPWTLSRRPGSRTRWLLGMCRTVTAGDAGESTTIRPGTLNGAETGRAYRSGPAGVGGIEDVDRREDRLRQRAGPTLEVAVAGVGHRDRVGPGRQHRRAERGDAVDSVTPRGPSSGGVVEIDRAGRGARLWARAVTVAVNVTDWPKSDVLPEVLEVVVEFARVTASVPLT